MTASGARPPVVVIGDVMTDVVARVDDPLALGSDTAAHVQTRQGGAGANVAHWLASFGCPVRFVGRVGDDPFGREAVAVLAGAGVDAHVVVDPVRSTGTVVVLVGADGERTMLPDAGANSALSADDLPPLTADDASWLHLSGYTLLNPGSRPAGEAALAQAAASGVPRSIDVASAAPLEAMGGKEFLRLTDGVELVFCTLDEAEVLVGTRDPDTAVARLTGTYRDVVLKTGATGARWAREDAPTVHVPACAAAAPVVDTTGAGDAFAAAYLAALLDDADVPERLNRACRAAAGVVVRVGARPPA
ncbi:MAG: carbohydrate kinase family protein [Angustibacter sp.]